MKKKIISGMIIILVIIAGVVLVKSKRNKEANLQPAKKYAVVVSTIRPELSLTRLTLPYIALVQNDADVTISSRIAARVNYIKPSGSNVKRGEVIVRLDATDVQSNINSLASQIEAVSKALENLKATHNRTLELLKVKGASIEQAQKEESGIVQMEAQLESLRQKKREAENMLGYAVIKSPVDGTMSKTMVNAGDMAMPGRPVGMLSAANGFYFLVRVPDDMSISGVVYEDTFFEAIPLNSTFNGLREYKVYTDDLSLKSGSREKVQVVVFEGEAVKLPQDAILNRDGRSFVFFAEGEKAIPHEVKILETGEEGLVVKNDELIGKQLVVAKQDVLLKLASGVSIKIKN